jgi:2-polyprenyl-3-methyl-5-hydroxy-6-metoxy-1,4-benzoquinol methylase
MDILKEKLRKWHGGRVLDVATGRGAFAEYLMASLADYDQIIGIDLSESNVNTAREHFGCDKVNFEVMDAGKMTYTDDSFDTVAIAYSLHHLNHIDYILAEMKRVLKPGGLFLLCEMYRDNQTEKQLTHVYLHHWWAEIDRTNGITHNETFTRQEIVDKVQKSAPGELEIFDLIEVDSDAYDEDKLTVEFLKICDQYMAKIKNASDRQRLMERGMELKKRVVEVGFEGASTLCALGRKPGRLI